MANKTTENTEKNSDDYPNLKPFEPGQSGNPKGRPKGARSNLGEAFLKDTLETWKTEGKDALLRASITDPMGFCRMVASILPKELNIKVDPLEEMTNEQLIANAVKLLGSPEILRQFAIGGGQPDAGDDQTQGGSKPVKKLSPVH